MKTEEIKPELSAEKVEQLKLFLEDNDPLRISRNLRKVFFDYLKFQQGNFDNNFDEIIFDIENTINLFEEISINTGSAIL